MNTREKKPIRSFLNNRLRVATPQAHIRKTLALKADKRRNDAVQERLATDNSYVWIGFCLL